ncbi:hypothetical protein GSH19_00010 [Lactobacillus sp. S2-2]|uniref:hypothetical protein n=1 Tax=Lactobacillus sp. S2-2 TaxID=2692917 RepID=UPI001F1886F3|nr:hypothetical protein [Lactobacillus sp. S2-2]MCF6514569.1 hypothetical protein [Lactobacillus sp. S2-2]
MSKLIDDTKMTKNIVSAKLIKVFYPLVIVKTIDGDTLIVKLSKNEKKDPMFWYSMRRIMDSKISIPIGRKYHQILDNDWEV